METAKKAITTAVDRMLLVRKAAKDAAEAAAKAKAEQAPTPAR